jgi:hypothetical protein
MHLHAPHTLSLGSPADVPHVSSLLLFFASFTYHSDSNNPTGPGVDPECRHSAYPGWQ